MYRFALWMLGYRGVCGCLGTLTEALHIPPRAADLFLKAVLVYILAGSYLGLA